VHMQKTRKARSRPSTQATHVAPLNIVLSNMLLHSRGKRAAIEFHPDGRVALYDSRRGANVMMIADDTVNLNVEVSARFKLAPNGRKMLAAAFRHGFEIAVYEMPGGMRVLRIAETDLTIPGAGPKLGWLRPGTVEPLIHVPRKSIEPVFDPQATRAIIEPGALTFFATTDTSVNTFWAVLPLPQSKIEPFAVKGSAFWWPALSGAGPGGTDDLVGIAYEKDTPIITWDTANGPTVVVPDLEQVRWLPEPEGAIMPAPEAMDLLVMALGAGAKGVWFRDRVVFEVPRKGQVEVPLVYNDIPKTAIDTPAVRVPRAILKALKINEHIQWQTTDYGFSLNGLPARTYIP